MIMMHALVDNTVIKVGLWELPKCARIVRIGQIPQQHRGEPIIKRA